MAIEIVDFPIKNGDFPVRYVSLPEGNSLLHLSGHIPIISHYTIILIQGLTSPARELRQRPHSCRYDLSANAWRKRLHGDPGIPRISSLR
jgi:hypothetical protein